MKIEDKKIQDHTNSRVSYLCFIGIKNPQTRIYKFYGENGNIQISMPLKR